MVRLSVEEMTHPALSHIFQRLSDNEARFQGQFPSYGDGELHYHLTANQNWLASFWAGLLWLRYAVTHEPQHLQNAQALLHSFQTRLDQQIRLNHDLGFLFTLSARAQFQLTQASQARSLALQAAATLLARFRPRGGYIQAWDESPEQGRFIIDCMMNLPLLFWASEQTGDQRYAEVAYTHAETSQRYLMQPDGGCVHTYLMDAASGTPLGAKTHQGYADDSLWSRGLAWAIYGFTLAAEWTGAASFRATAEAAAQRYMAEVSPQQIAVWDFRLPAAAPHHLDSSADAIAAGGMLRLARLTQNGDYRAFAEQRLTLLSQVAFDRRETAEGLLLYGTQHAPHGYGIETYTIFGDYFYLEALLALHHQAPDFWGKA
jgi:unsaturated chondroitin disaccharide hydrolase